MKQVKRNYSNAFKEEAVRLSYQRDNIKDLADELGVQVQRIYKWRTAHRNNEKGIGISSKLHQEDTLEVKRLKKELKNTQLELEILKKAVHIFSKCDGKSINS